MTKDQLQKELKEKVQPGIKPSHLKKLKRSKSEGDIPKAPPLPTSTQITLLQQQVQFHAETAQSYLQSLQTSQAKNACLTEQLTTKQKDLESLRQQLETTNQELNSLKSTNSNLLDTNLTLKHQSLKDWWQQYEKTKELETELKENVDYASDELIQQDKTINQLRGENNQLKLTNQSLTKDLDLATKLAELRKNPLPENNSNYSDLVFYAFLAFWFISLLNSSWNHNFKDNE